MQVKFDGCNINMKASCDLITTSKSPPPPSSSSDESSQWTNLPADILRLIANQFLSDIVDRTCFRDVWKLHVDWIPNMAEPPWLLTNLSDSNRPIIIYPSVTSCARGVRVCKFENKNCRERLSRAVVLVSKVGWLLLAEGRSTSALITTTCFILWNPFTSTKFKEPQLPATTEYCLHPSSLATFTSNPDFPDCVFFLVNRTITQDRRLRIITCKAGDDSWEKHLFECHHDVDAIMWKQGTLFCLLNNGSLVGFSLADNSWTHVLIDGHVDVDTHGLGHHGRYLVDFWDNPDLAVALLLHGSDGNWWLLRISTVQKSQWIGDIEFNYQL